MTVRNLVRPAVLAALLAGTVGTALAGAFTVTPVRIYMTPRDRAVALTITNEGDSELVIQADINVWSQDGQGRDRLELTEDLILAPPIVMALEPASAGASRAPRTFEAADADGDGFVTLREARAVRGLAAQLIEADANRDGRLDKVEYARALSRTEPSR